LRPLSYPPFRFDSERNLWNRFKIYDQGRVVCAREHRRATEGRNDQEPVVELKRQIAAAGHVLVKEYIDDGITGTLLERPALEQLRLDAKTGLFDKVYFHAADRIAREAAHQTVIIGELVTRRLPPPRLAGGINGSTYAHSSSVRSLGYLK
jgi:hypothetical protein